MISSLWFPPLVRAITTALLVISASAFAEVLGPFWGALVASLPVSAGPAYLFLAMQHEVGFVAESSLGSLAANAATGLFLIAYGIVSRSLSSWRSLSAATLTWLFASIAIRQIFWTPLTAMALNLLVYGVGFYLLGTIRGAVSKPPILNRKRWFNLLVRGLSVAAFVSLVVAAGSTIGPRATGIVAVFPISLISLIVIVRPRIGGEASSLLAANALRSMLGFGVMLLAFHLAVATWGVRMAFVVALLVCLSWSTALLLLRWRSLPS